jgi:hypothetical protein
VDIKVFGHDMNDAMSTAKELRERMSKLSTMRDAQLSREDLQPEYNVVFDRDKLSYYGMNSATAAQFVRNRIYGFECTKYREDGDEYDIVVRYDEPFRESLETVENITLYSATGQPVKLKEVARIEESFASPTIERENRQRIVTVKGSVGANIALGDAVAEVTAMINDYEAPAGITLDLGGHTLTVAGLDVIDNTGKMTVCNGNIVANNTENTRRCIYNHGEMVINGVNFVQTYNQKGAAINNEGKLTIENATVNAVFYSIWTSGKNAETIVNGGTYTTTNDVNIRDNWAYAVIANNGAKLTVNGGSFTGNHGAIAVEGGATATLNAGTFHCTAEYTGNSDWALYTDKDSALTYNKNNCTVTSANPSGAVYGNVTAF